MGHELATIRLDRPVPGLDHLRAIDRSQLCSVLYSVDTDADLLGLDSPKDYAVWPGGSSRWWPASSGLKTIRGLIAHYEARIASGSDSIGGMINSALPEILTTLKQIEGVLDKADTHDRRFHFAID